MYSTVQYNTKQYSTIQNITVLYPILASIKTKMEDIVLTFFHRYIFSFDVHKHSKIIGGAPKIKKDTEVKILA